MNTANLANKIRDLSARGYRVVFWPPDQDGRWWVSLHDKPLNPALPPAFETSGATVEAALDAAWNEAQR